MASSMARGGRRRRVLNEEARSASGASLAAFSGAPTDADAPRYSEQAGVEHHPQVTDFVPRRKRAMLITLLAGGLAAAAAQALTVFAEPIATALPGVTADQLATQIAGGLTAWFSAVALAIVYLLARLMYSLRRHRVDDYQGRYRVWRWMAFGSLVASAEAVVGAHQLVAQSAARATGWSLSASGSEWWLAPIAMAGGWIFVRMLLEVGECRSSLLMMLGAAGCYSVAAAEGLGWSPASLGPWATIGVGAAGLIGHTMLLVGMLVFARYVVLDVQGLIEHSPRPATPKEPRKKTEPTPAVKLAAATASHTTGSSKTVQAPIREGAQDRWEGEQDADDDQDGATRRLSKADRKRLRKQNRAA